MKIFELTIGYIKHFVAANDEQHAHEIGSDPELHPELHYLPFVVTEVVVPGHVISVAPEIEEAEADEEETEDKPTPKRGRPKAS